jgi:hypothetical protein
MQAAKLQICPALRDGGVIIFLYLYYAYFFVFPYVMKNIFAWSALRGTRTTFPDRMATLQPRDMSLRDTGESPQCCFAAKCMALHAAVII